MKIFAAILLIIIALSFMPGFVFAQRIDCPPSIDPNALVPCGGPTCPCTLCDFFDMIARIINFAMTRIVPIIAALMIVIAGAMMISAYAGQSGPDIISRAKRLLGSLAVGLFIVYLAWIIINMFLVSIDVAEWTGLDNWWTIECESSGVPEHPPGDTFCGDGIWQPLNDDGEVEECDGNSFPISSSCIFFGFVSTAEALCDRDCGVDTSPCEEMPPTTYCGDNIRQYPNDNQEYEDCDGTDLLGLDCTYFGFTEPEGLACSNCEFDTSSCSSEPFTYCGDGIIQTPNSSGYDESCDGDDLDGLTCLDFSGFTSPEGLACSACQFDTSGCRSEPLTYCGDNIIQNPNDDNVEEVCDGSDLGGESCAALGYSGGDLACQSDCLALDESACTLFNDDCRTCRNNIFGLCEEEECYSLGDDCVYVPVRSQLGGDGYMCVAENQCYYCGYLAYDICTLEECTAIGPDCFYDENTGSCILQ